MSLFWNFFVISLLITCSAWAKLSSTTQEIHLATFPIPLLVESESSGLFIDLTKEIAKRNRFKIHIHMMPVGKGILEFSTKKVDGYFPAHKMSIEKGAAKTIPFFLKRDFIFYRKDMPLKELKALEGKRVGLTVRYHYVNEMLSNKKISFKYAEDDFMNMKNLGQGVIDAFVVEEMSGLRALQKSGYKNIEFDKNFPISEQAIYYAFQETPEGQVLRDAFDKTLTEMKEDGTLARLLKTRK